MTESVHQQVLRPGGDIIGGAFPHSEPGRRPRPLPDRPQVTANIIEHRRDFLFGKLLDQPEQLFPLHAHDLSVRSKVQRAWPSRRVRHVPDRDGKRACREGGGVAGHEDQCWLEKGRRPIGGPLTSVTKGLSRTLTRSLSRRSGRATGPDGTDSQADSAGSIPVTRSSREHAASAVFFRAQLKTSHEASLLARARCVPDWRRLASARLLISAAIILSRSDVRCC